MGTPVSRPVRVLVASLVIALVVGAASTAAFATGANPNAKLAIHLKAHPTSCTKGYPTFTNASTIVYNWANSGDVDAMPVFYDLTQYTVVETGLTWPAGWGTGSWTKCKGDLIIGTITNPGDGFAIAWTACQTSWAITPGYEWLTATSAGQVLPVPDPVTEDYGVVDCAPEPGPYYQYPIAIYAGGVDGGVGENPTVNPVCNVDPAALDFGTVTIGGWQQRSFTLKNTGGGEMTGRVSVAPADSATWSLISGGGLYVLKNNEFINIVVQFKPKTAGTYNTTILTGASICSGVACTGVGEAANPPACQVNPASLNFMSVVVGDSLDKSFTITNTGGGTLSGTVTASCTDFSIVSGGGAYNLTGGQRDTVVVRFKPTSAVTESCTVNTGGSCAAVKCQGSGEYLPLTISKDDGIAANACAFPSSNVTYTLTYSNPNHTQVTGVVVTDNLPTNVTFVSATNGGVYSGGNNQVTWNIGTLGAGVGASVGVTTTVKPSASPDSGLANNCQITSNETPTPVIASHSTAVCACAISGPSLACPLSTIQFCAPAGMTSYAWSVSGNGSVSGAANGQCVMVLAGAACNSSYTVKLDLVQAGGVQSHCEYVVSVNDTSTPQITSCPGAIHVQCKGNVPAADTALVTATDSCGVVHVTFVGDVSDGHTCPEVITRTYRATDLCGNHADCIQT
ncbi:MAG TPA: choice-of-anchor D domain-containing protein, partial [bacterium]|nr:choice-of-anchor D domain-containing protein [bacterium]